MRYVPTKNDISPTLRDILSQFDEDNHRPSDFFPAAQQAMVQEDINDCDHSEVEGNAFDDCGSWNYDHNENASYAHNDPDDSFTSPDANFPSFSDVCILHYVSCCYFVKFLCYQNFLFMQENGEHTIRDPNMDQKLEKIADFLSLGLGFTSISNAWAGPEHWKYRKAKGVMRSKSLQCTFFCSIANI